MLSALTVVALIAAAAMPCENLKSISLQNTAITISEFPNGRYNLENVAEDKPVAVGKRVDNRVGQPGSAAWS